MRQTSPRVSLRNNAVSLELRRPGRRPGVQRGVLLHDDVRAEPPPPARTSRTSSATRPPTTSFSSPSATTCLYLGSTHPVPWRGRGAGDGGKWQLAGPRPAVGLLERNRLDLDERRDGCFRGRELLLGLLRLLARRPGELGRAIGQRRGLPLLRASLFRVGESVTRPFPRRSSSPGPTSTWTAATTSRATRPARTTAS